jgi:translation elongation factor EF-Tu-like GTPase
VSRHLRFGGCLVLHPPAPRELYRKHSHGQAAGTPFASDYQPQFYFRTTDVSGSLDLGGAAVVNPGDSVEVTVALGKAVAMEPGLGFAVREGNRTVAAGAVTAVLD